MAEQDPIAEMTEHLSFMDMLAPWPHHLHILDDDPDGIFFAACDCGWVGPEFSTRRLAATSYRDHIEKPA